MSQLAISAEVSEILNRSTWDDAAHTVTIHQVLERKEYEAVDKIIKASGGKWNRGKKCHVFDDAAYGKLREALGSGSIRDDKKHFQEYFTPAALAARVVELAQVGGCSVLEPSAGRGALAKECIAQGAGDVFCFEIQPQHAESLSLDGRYQDVICGDFLQHKPGSREERFERIVMNPPFTKGAAIKHVAHARDNWLAPGGRLVAVMPNIKDGRDFAKFTCPGTHQMKEIQFEDVPEGTFQESGTGVRTMIVIIDAK